MVAAAAAENACDHVMQFLPSDLSMSFLQMQHDLHSELSPESACGGLVNGLNGDPLTFFNNNCKYHIHGSECARPIPDVMAEHPGLDGYCYFSDVAWYIHYDPPTDDLVKGVYEWLLEHRKDYKGLNNGPLVTFHHNGKAIKSHIDAVNYVYDDLYSYSLKLLQGQGRTVDQLKDPAAWKELTRAKCQEIQETYHFTNDELVLGDILDMNMPITAMSHCSAGYKLPPELHVPYVTEKAEYHSITDCKKITDREYARHHYMKCLMGIDNAAADAAYCFGRGCLLDGGTRIGHFADCPFDLEKEGV